MWKKLLATGLFSAATVINGSVDEAGAQEGGCENPWGACIQECGSPNNTQCNSVAAI
jgi:hypothetical protein